MTRNLVRAMMGFGIVAGILVVAPPAKAIVWKSYANENYCMGASGGTMTPGTKIILWQCNGAPDQTWGEYYTGVDDWDQWYDEKAPAPEDPASVCWALPAGHTELGTYFVIWNCTTNTDDQHWQFFPVFKDALGHWCYSFENQLASERGEGNRVPTIYLGEVQNGQLIVLEQYAADYTQIWCAY